MWEAAARAVRAMLAVVMWLWATEAVAQQTTMARQAAWKGKTMVTARAAARGSTTNRDGSALTAPVGGARALLACVARERDLRRSRRCMMRCVSRARVRPPQRRHAVAAPTQRRHAAAAPATHVRHARACGAVRSCEASVARRWARQRQVAALVTSLHHPGSAQRRRHLQAARKRLPVWWSGLLPARHHRAERHRARQVLPQRRGVSARRHVRKGVWRTARHPLARRKLRVFLLVGYPAGGRHAMQPGNLPGIHWLPRHRRRGRGVGWRRWQRRHCGHHRVANSRQPRRTGKRTALSGAAGEAGSAPESPSLMARHL